MEVCAPSRIIFGHCVEFNVPGGVIQDQISAACSETFPKCDAYYLSTTAYKYLDCYKLVSMSATKTTKATNSDESKKSMIALYIPLAVMCLAILIVAIHIICMFFKRKKENLRRESSITEHFNTNGIALRFVSNNNFPALSTGRSFSSASAI